MNAGRNDDTDNEISVISSVRAKKLYSDRFGSRKQTQRAQWHSDITFEPVPSDYSLLRLTQLPKTGGGESSLRLRFRVNQHSDSYRHPVGLRI